MFLEYNQLKSIAPLDIVNLIMDNSQDDVNIIIEESIDVIKTYISNSYDGDWLFSLRGDQRNKALVKTLKNITIYEIYCRRSRVVNEVVERRYNDSMRFLEHISQGKITPADWDRPPEDVEEENDEDSPYLFTTGKDRYQTSF